ncbi:MAG: alpha/beta hydrolase [Pseudonocardiaceae bacterium]
MAEVSARPDNLTTYRSNLEAVDQGLRSVADRLLPLLEAYHDHCSDWGVDYRGLAHTLRKHATAMEQLDGWVGRVGEAFRNADHDNGSAPSGVVRTIEASVDRVMADALEAEYTKFVVLPQFLSISDPQQVYDWWLTLTQEERDAITAAHPDTIGNVDGIPCIDRDKANRTVLAQQLDTLNAQLQDLRAHEPPPDDAGRVFWDVKMQSINDQLNGLNAINNRLNHPQPGQPQAFLLGLDTQGNGHAIIAINDPDTADNVITYVPGTGARLGNIGGYTDQSDSMVRSANIASPKQATSSITWIGYDAPPDLPHAAFPGYAKNAEGSLRNFEVGLRTTHEGPPSLNTIIGHSYGSTTVGFAMRDGGLPVDKVIFVGSPGVGVENASDLGIDPSNVYVGLAGHDPIRLGRLLGVNRAGPFGLLEVVADDITGDRPQVFGRDPSVPQFGANQLPTDSGGDHSHYFDQASPSLKAIGQVAVGQQPHA